MNVEECIHYTKKRKINPDRLTVLTLGDPHFKVKNIKDTELMVQKVINLVTETKPHLIVVLGDILDRFESIHVSPLVRAVKFLIQLSNLSKVIVLIGNHDRQNNSDFLSDFHPFTALEENPNIIIASKVIDLHVKLNENGIEFIDGNLIDSENVMHFALVPYVYPGRFEEALNTNKWISHNGIEKLDCIFAHQEFRGCKMGVVKSIVGDEWAPERPFVVSGHIHEYQVLQENIVYTGSLLQNNYGDNHDKTISFFDMIKGSKITITERRVSLDLPKKMIIRLTCDEVSDCKICYDDEVKIVISGNIVELKSIDKSNKVLKWRKRGIPVQLKEIVNKEDPNKTTDENNTSVDKKTFTDALYQNVKKEKSIRRLFKELFGDI